MLVNIQLATLQDMPALQELLSKANLYSLQFSARLAWEKIDKAYAAMQKQIELGNVFIIRGNNGITSSITVSEENDLWGEIGRDEKALYFTKWIKDPEEAQKDEAMKLLTFAAAEAKKRNKIFLRCDVVSDQQKLFPFYKHLGFEERGNFFYKPSTREGTLMEIPINQLLI